MPTDRNLTSFERCVVVAVTITVFRDVMHYNIINTNITEEPVYSLRAP